MLDKKFIFCFYSPYFSNKFLNSWADLCDFLQTNKIKHNVVFANHTIDQFAKTICLAGDMKKGKYQKPFMGEDYDYIVFINGGIEFAVEDFMFLYNSLTPDVKIVSAAVTDEEGERFAKYKSTSNNIVKVEYADFDFTFVEKGIFEKLEYPWFIPHNSILLDDADLCDVGICRKIKKELNLDVYINRNIKLCIQ